MHAPRIRHTLQLQWARLGAQVKCERVQGRLRAGGHDGAGCLEHVLERIDGMRPLDCEPARRTIWSFGRLSAAQVDGAAPVFSHVGLDLVPAPGLSFVRVPGDKDWPIAENVVALRVRARRFLWQARLRGGTTTAVSLPTRGRGVLCQARGRVTTVLPGRVVSRVAARRCPFVTPGSALALVTSTLRMTHCAAVTAAAGCCWPMHHHM